MSFKHVWSSHPPLEKITFKHKKTDVVASPFQHPTSEEAIVSKVIAQNNYTNQCLHVIGKQLDRMEEQVENKVILQPGNPSKSVQTLEKPLVKLPTTRQTSLKSKDQTTIEIVVQKMEELAKKELVTPSPNITSSSKLIVLDTHIASSNSSRTSSDSEKEIEHLENQFRGLEVKKLHQPTLTTLTKNWYPRPTPPDLQFEERNSNQFSVSSSKLYEWNINGLAEQEILNKIQHMTMVASNYLNEGHSHTEVKELMSLRFTGKVLQWWDNCLTEESKEDIKHAVQKDEEGTPIFDERIGKGVPDGVNTLIYTIMKHFVRKPSNITSRIYDQLSNLRCKNLGEYRWNEDVFTTRVMHRSDCNSPFWKEKFINGLPRLFGEKVKETLSTTLGVIDYDNLTYGDISSTIRSEGMKMCRDLKIQSQASKSKAKYKVGNFCIQYGLPSIIPKRKSKFREKGFFEKSHRRRTTIKYYRKQKFKADDFYTKGKSKSTASGKCFNCGKRGHFRKK